MICAGRSVSAIFFPSFNRSDWKENKLNPKFPLVFHMKYLINIPQRRFNGLAYSNR